LVLVLVLFGRLIETERCRIMMQFGFVLVLFWFCFGVSLKQSAAGLLEKKWSSVLRLQKKVMQLEEENKQLRENMSSSAVNKGSLVVVGLSKIQTKKKKKKKGNKVSALPIAPAAHVLKGHRGGIVCVAFHPLFPLLATASEDATVKTFDSEEGKFERTLKGHTNSVNCVAFSATGNLLVSGSSDLSLKLWSTETWDCVKTMQGHDHVVSDVKFASGDTLILSCSRDQSIRVWDASTGYCTKTLRGHSEWVRSLSVSMKGLVVSAGHDRTVRCWNLATGATV
jgi:platelet-activating factor acetylhydrolase IB subunit alpha